MNRGFFDYQEGVMRAEEVALPALAAQIRRPDDLLDHWLEQVGVSTNTLMSARLGRR